MAPDANLWFLVFQRGFRSSLTQNGRQCPTVNLADPPENLKGYKVYKRITLIVISLLVGYNTVLYLKNKSCVPEGPKFCKYSYMRIRHKRFPWADGDKSLFHNLRVNALPGGYEDDEQNRECEE